MKARPLLILLLFAASTGILVWIYYTTTREHTALRNTKWAQTLSDLDACGRIKHLKAAQYDHFANIAQNENQTDAARLFRAMAFSARLHEYNCANVILRLNGHYTPPTKTSVFRGTTDNNLQRSINYERTLLAKQGSGDIERALSDGNRYAARVLIWAKAGDVRHMAMMEQCHNETCLANRATTKAKATRNTTQMSSEGYLVCPECGNMYTTACCDPYCPFCLTNGQSFVRF